MPFATNGTKVPSPDESVANPYPPDRFVPEGATGMVRNGGMMKKLLLMLLNQERSLKNARIAATELCRQRVEREEVALYLEQRRHRVSRSA